MYPINAKLDFHAFMGIIFKLISGREGFRKKEKVKLGLLAEVRGVGV